eukprot:8065947-Heterocapsa_arctica.AAC.1
MLKGERKKLVRSRHVHRRARMSTRKTKSKMVSATAQEKAGMGGSASVCVIVTQQAIPTNTATITG